MKYTYGTFGRMALGDLIEWLSKQDRNLVIKDGIGKPHCDRGDYSDIAFDPTEQTTIAQMLAHAKSALGETFEGWKGGDYVMDKESNVLIGEHGDCGEPITSYTLKYWLLTAEK